MRDGLLGAPAGPVGTDRERPERGRRPRLPPVDEPDVAGERRCARCRPTSTRPVPDLEALFAAVRAGTGNVALAPLWEGDAGRSPLSGAGPGGRGGRLRPVAHAGRLPRDPTTAATWWPSAACSPHLAAGLGTDGVGVVAHDAKELMRSLLPLGVDITGLVIDTAVAAYLLDPSRRPLPPLRPGPPLPRRGRRRRHRGQGSGRLPVGDRAGRTPTVAAAPTGLDPTGLGLVRLAAVLARLAGAVGRGPRRHRRGASSSTTWSVPWCGCWPAWRSWGSRSTARCCGPSPPS